MKRKNIRAGTLCTRQQGMTLLEIVVSMLIVALGLAMSVSMIQTANRFGDTAEYTAFAQQKSQFIIDAMRANNIARDTYLLNQDRADPNVKILDYKQLYDSLSGIYDVGDITSYLKCKTSNCTEAEKTAKEDMQAWVNAIRTLPGGRGIIRQSDGQYEIVVMWSHVSETSQSNAAVPVQGTRVWFTL